MVDSSLVPAPAAEPPMLTPTDAARLGRLGFDPTADHAGLLAGVARRGWDARCWPNERGDGNACSVTRERPARFFPTQAVGRGATPCAALAAALLRLGDPDRDLDLEAAVARAVRHRRGRHGLDGPFDPFAARRRRPETPPAADAAAPVRGVAYRPRRAASLRRRGGWYAAGEVEDRLAGERLRVWMRPDQVAEVRTERLG